MTGRSEELAGGEPETAAAQPEMLEDVRREIILLLTELPEMPSTLSVQASGVAVELSWDGGTQLEPGSAAPGEAAPEPGDTAADVGSEGDEASMHYVCAPTVGVFYSSPQPGAKPFVAQGDLVSDGEQVAIVEAMKLFLPVEADRVGRVARILVADGSSVEFGEHLIAIEDIKP